MSASQRDKGARGELEVVELLKALRQVDEAASDQDVPIVAHRRDGEPWRATLPLEDLLELLAWREQA